MPQKYVLTLELPMIDRCNKCGYDIILDEIENCSKIFYYELYYVNAQSAGDIDNICEGFGNFYQQNVFN